jgi:TPP-dependent 2-oxoacid decarboxylase
MELAEKMQAPVAVINTAKAVIDETFPQYLASTSVRQANRT